MATYPTTPKPRYPFTLTPEFSTLVSNFDGGQEQRRSKQLFPIYDVTVNYKYLSITDVKTLYEFYMEMKGMYEAFYIFDQVEHLLHTFIHKGQYCATADGTSTIYDIPGKSTSAQTIYVDNVDETSGCNILVGGGNSDSDRIEFTVAPVAGNIITADFAGHLRMKVRFANDKLARTNVVGNFYSYSIQLKGLRGL